MKFLADANTLGTFDFRPAPPQVPRAMDLPDVNVLIYAHREERLSGDVNDAAIAAQRG